MHIGIDVGERRLFGAALGGGQLQFCPSTDPAAVLAWTVALSPASVAVDSPPAVSLGLAKKGARRICEELLGISGCYATPRHEQTLPAWMAAGMDAHRQIGQLLREPLDLSGTGRVFEVHPTYGFRSILGVLDRHEQSPQVVCDPRRLLCSKSPRGSVGHNQRVEILALFLGLFGVPMSSELRKELLRSLDVTDSALCAVLGGLRSRSQCRMVGDPREGTIVIADPAKLATVVSRCVTAVRATATPAAAPPPPTPVRMTRDADFEAAILRLGAQGLGLLSQDDTLKALDGQGSQGDVVMPAGLRTIGRDWLRAVEQGGFWVILSFGQICGALRVTQIVGEGRVRPTKKAVVIAQNRDPWPGITEAEYWLIGDTWLRFPCPYPFDAIRTRRRLGYVAGLSKSQSAWVAVQIVDPQLRRELQLL